VTTQFFHSFKQEFGKRCEHNTISCLAAILFRLNGSIILKVDMTTNPFRPVTDFRLIQLGHGCGMGFPGIIVYGREYVVESASMEKQAYVKMLICRYGWNFNQTVYQST